MDKSLVIFSSDMHQEQNTRPYQEDMMLKESQLFKGSHKVGTYIVLDGHGGNVVVELCQKNIIDIIREKYKQFEKEDNLKPMFFEVFKALNDKMVNMNEA